MAVYCKELYNLGISKDQLSTLLPTATKSEILLNAIIMKFIKKIIIADSTITLKGY